METTEQAVDAVVHEFTLLLEGMTEISDTQVAALYESGCDDAGIASVRGRVTIEFDRDAPSLKQAVAGAERDIRRAGLTCPLRVVGETWIGRPLHEFEFHLDIEFDSLDMDALFEAGCGDASFGVCAGQPYAVFDRRAFTRQQAIDSAVADLRRAGVTGPLRLADETADAPRRDSSRRDTA